MAVSIGVLFSPTVLTGSVATIYTVPATPTTTTLANGRVRFTNTANAPVSVTWYAVPASGTAGPGNCQGNAESIAANAHVDVDVPLMGPGGTIQALAGTANDITMSALAGVLFS
jgi:hypothetical protein